MVHGESHVWHGTSRRPESVPCPRATPGATAGVRPEHTQSKPSAPAPAQPKEEEPGKFSGGGPGNCRSSAKSVYIVVATTPRCPPARVSTQQPDEKREREREQSNQQPGNKIQTIAILRTFRHRPFFSPLRTPGWPRYTCRPRYTRTRPPPRSFLPNSYSFSVTGSSISRSHVTPRC